MGLEGGGSQHPCEQLDQAIASDPKISSGND